MGRKPKQRTIPRRYEPGFITQLDQRTDLGRTLRLRFDTITEEAGGLQNLSRVKIALVERFVFMDALLSTWETEIATKPGNSQELVNRWIQGVNTLQGLARSIGVEKPQDGGPTLDQVLAEHASDEDDDDERPKKRGRKS